MVNLVYDYIPELPHDEHWSKGYNLKKTCKDYINDMINCDGPEDGLTITLNNLPDSKNEESIYLRFWAAQPNPEKWDNYKNAYNEFKSKYERMPNPKYKNGGMVKVENNKASIKILLPQGYKDKSTKKTIPSHFHYRLCINNKFGPVHTQFIN